jgi:RimJ/RimL family protein N-acetyltransferase
MIKIIPFKTEHFQQIEVRTEILQEEIEAGKYQKWASVYAQYPSLTIIDGSKIVACFGVYYLHPYTAECWLRTCQDVIKYKDILIEQIYALGGLTWEMWHLKRIQTTVQKDWIVAQKFAEHLGFIKEGELKNYIGKATYIMYAKYRE